jgi:hypothetical protein
MNNHKKDNINLLVLDVNIHYDANVIKSSYPNEYITNKYILKNKRLLSNDNELCYTGEFIRFLGYQTEEIFKLAVKQNGNALQYVKEEFQTEEICQLAVKKNGKALQYVNEKLKTEEICKLSIENDPSAMMFIKDEEIYYKIVA